MSFVRPRARILEISTTSGGGPLALSGAADGSYNSFASFMAVGDQTYATVVEPGVAFWSGIATYSATNELTLTTVEETKGTFGAGTKEVMATPLASTSMFREDIAGAIVTGGTSTAYTVASYRGYNTLAELNGNITAFTPHATNGATVTLNVDGLGAKPLRSAPTIELPAGVLVAGTPYVVLYNHADGVFYLQNSFFGNPYNIPIGGCIDFFGATAPNSALVMPYGQAISRTVYATLFALLGTTFGPGDGSTTFNVPDIRGRVVAGADGMGGASAGRLTDPVAGIDALGDAGGSQSRALGTANLPPYTPTGTVNTGSVKIYNGIEGVNGPGGVSTVKGGTLSGTAGTQSTTLTEFSGFAFAGNAQGGTSDPFSIVQPTIVANKLMRVI